MHRSEVSATFLEAVQRLLNHQEAMVSEAEAARRREAEQAADQSEHPREQGPYPLPDPKE